MSKQPKKIKCVHEPIVGTIPFRLCPNGYVVPYQRRCKKCGKAYCTICGK